MARKSTNPHETILRNLDALTRDELEALQEMIASKLATMRAKSGLLVDVLAQDEQTQDTDSAPAGSWVEEKYIPSPSGKTHGPYYYLRWRDESGKMRSKYLKGYGKSRKHIPTPQESTAQE